MADTLAPATQSQASTRQGLVAALRSCATEADIVQVLYQYLRSAYGYDVVALTVLEREGWYHAVGVDQGILQDVQRRRLVESLFAPFYEAGKTEVIHPPVEEAGRSRGPGARKVPRTIIFSPLKQGETVMGAVLYQSYEERAVPPSEVDFLEDVARDLSVLTANAYLNEVTRNQAVRLTALNAVARALASTLDEGGVVAALHETLSQLLPVEVVELVVPDEETPSVLRVLRSGDDQSALLRIPRRSPRVSVARSILEDPRTHLKAELDGAGYRSGCWVPVREGGATRAVLSIHSRDLEAYEESTVTFLAQVADEVALALRNAHSYAALEAQRRRLEVVNAVGRRLASSLDRWSIMRTLREELSRHLKFEFFGLATIHQGDEGPMADGYSWIDGNETVYTVPLAGSGPSREAYESGQPVLVRRSPWATRVEAQHPTGGLVEAGGAMVYVADAGRRGRVAARSIVWVPVRRGERVTALLSLQSYRAGVFTDWHVHLLQDVAAHVSLALANAEYFAAAQAERRRLEALHVLELGVAGSADEAQIANAVFTAAREYVSADNFLLVYLDPDGLLGGFGSEHGGPTQVLDPKPVERTVQFRRLQETGQTFAGHVPEEARRPGSGWPGTKDSRMPVEVVWVPVLQDNRVVAALSAQRFEENSFSEDEVRLMESAAPIVGIALRTVRLHRANELALAHSVRMQEVAALAGHELAGVVASIADQARNMLGAAGAACWAFDAEGRTTAEASSGDATAARVLQWAGRDRHGGWPQTPRAPLSGARGASAWSLVPLWYADTMVGALGSIHAGTPVDEAASGTAEFARHAAIAIENARLGAETRDRIRTLEAVANFTELDITRPAHTQAEMAALVERALSASQGALWITDEDSSLRRVGDGLSVPLEAPSQTLRHFRSNPIGSRAKALLKAMGSATAVATPILVEGKLAGLVVAQAGAGSPAETRRLMSVLAGQAGVVLGRLRLVEALARERRTLDSILRHSPVGVILEDETGQVVYANPEAEQLYGVEVASFTGRAVDDILGEAGAQVTADPDAEPDAPSVLTLRAPQERVIEVRRVPLPGIRGEPAGVLSLHEDVTRERQVLEAKDLMLRAIGHEVRSPAAAMKTTLAGILQWERHMDAEQRTSLLVEAYEMSDRLLNLVEGQLIIAKLETRQFEPNPAQVQLAQAVEHVMAVLQHRYGDRIERVSVRLPRTLPAAFCEPTHLDQVLTNLVGNALEYTGAPIHVSARAHGEWLEVTVSDEGPGLPVERVESLFRKTAPAGQNRARGGLGLGLYLCRLVVERSFGGRIWLAGTGGGGTTFKFTVPASGVAAQRRAAATGG
ncbi:MAG: GAF domain-containing protein [Chloroflexi bacterium]|nr:MAG: GAF domain-containing protein [Chloroflexota bacterium]